MPSRRLDTESRATVAAKSDGTLTVERKGASSAIAPRLEAKEVRSDYISFKLYRPSSTCVLHLVFVTTVQRPAMLAAGHNSNVTVTSCVCVLLSLSSLKLICLVIGIYTFHSRLCHSSALLKLVSGLVCTC